MRLLFLTPRGSRLYGTSSENSDFDFFAVTTKPKTKRAKFAKQSITTEHDLVWMDFGTFTQYALGGVPENLEAMFSRKAIYDDIAEFRESFYVGTTAHERFLRTIKSFAAHQDYKRKRHGLRLALNFYDLSRYGRYNPTLTHNEVDFVTDVAHKDTDVVYAYCMNIALDRLPPFMVR